MSGGHWNYNQSRLEEILSEVGQDWSHTRWPQTMATLRALAPVLADIIGDMDWDLSGDSSISDDIAFDAESMKKLRKVLDGDGHQ